MPAQSAWTSITAFRRLPKLAPTSIA